LEKGKEIWQGIGLGTLLPLRCLLEQSPGRVSSGDGMDVDTKDSGISKMTQQGEEVDKL
jgi:hypothetical protein